MANTTKAKHYNYRLPWHWIYPEHSVGGYHTFANYDACTAEFHRPRPSKLDVTGMLVRRHREPQNWCEYTNTDRYPPDTGGEHVHYSPSHSLEEKETLKLRVKSKFADSLAQLGESAADLRETRDMIVSRGNQLNDGFRGIATGDFHRAASAFGGPIPSSVRHLPKGLKRIAGSFLELQWGWMPLISDIYAAVEAYQHKLQVGQIVHHGATVWDPSHPAGNNNVGNGLVARGSTTYHISARVKNSNTATLSQLGLVNPALIAWEALPFSFLIDWFFHVGDALATLAWDVGLDDVLAWYSDIDTTCIYAYRKPKGLTSYHMTITRSKATTDIAFDKIQWFKGCSLSIGQVVSIAALLALLLI